MDKQRFALIEFDMGWSMWLTKEHLPFYIGRHFDNDLINSSYCVSRKHCKLELIDNKLHLVDNGSMNGTVLHNRVIHNESLVIEEKTCLLLSDMMIWVTPCDEEGNLNSSHTKETLAEHDESTKEPPNGICVVDICDSMTRELDYINHICQVLRMIIISHSPDKILSLKYTGDGYLAIFSTGVSAVLAAKRLLKWQASDDNLESIDIRIALDAGLTYRAYGHERTGFPICRTARIEKLQKRDIASPSKDIGKLKSKNRCLFTKDISLIIDEQLNYSYDHIGSCKLKGFANELYDIYQL